MERSPQRYFCNKCGYVGSSDTHPGCNYFAYPMAHLEQIYIDHLEAELEALRASPASAPEGAAFIPEKIGNVESGFEGMFLKEAQAYKRGWNACCEAMLAAAPTPQVTEDQKDADRLNYLQEHGATVHLVSTTNSNLLSFVIGGLHRSKRLNLREAIDAAMQEDKP